jgi:type II secretory pathway component PulK
MSKQTMTRGRSGMALFAAIALLAVFALLGTAYLGYMWLEFADAGVQLHRTRARNLAAGGVYAAVGEIQSALDSSGQPETTYEFSLATYRQEQDGLGAYPQRVTVTVADESARVNLNTAPAALLRAMGIDTASTDKLVSMRGRGERLASVDALRANDIVDAQKYDALHKDDFTVYTGAKSGGDLNLNTASPRVLAATFGISADEASQLAAKRPFTDWTDALQKAGREPSTFNLEVAPFAPREKPAGVSFSSKCFRVQSAATLDMPGGDHRPVHAAVEAVIAFDDEGGYAIRSWRELRGADARTEGNVEPDDAADRKTSDETN